ncbi:hypothetical protein QOZ95_003581 [Paenibacillus brasilensis]|uniref:Uncharacterized protein n=1 Tax=Paenibacillus brasilensis TaxID=128574 RepID=A0ABU0L3A1_9BACL|nr:hypothetical protein [Paenibacillus brasilensis]
MKNPFKEWHRLPHKSLINFDNYNNQYLSFAYIFGTRRERLQILPEFISKEAFQLAGEDGRQQALARAYLLRGLIVRGECRKTIGTYYSMMGNVKHSGRKKLKYVTNRCRNRDPDEGVQKPLASPIIHR